MSTFQTFITFILTALDTTAAAVAILTADAARFLRLDVLAARCGRVWARHCRYVAVELPTRVRARLEAMRVRG